MNTLAKVFSTMFDRQPLDTEGARSQQIHREWDRQRTLAVSPADLAEIDAIFARSL
jgi:hypothetical protein